MHMQKDIPHYPSFIFFPLSSYTGSKESKPKCSHTKFLYDPYKECQLIKSEANLKKKRDLLKKMPLTC